MTFRNGLFWWVLVFAAGCAETGSPEEGTVGTQTAALTQPATAGSAVGNAKSAPTPAAASPAAANRAGGVTRVYRSRPNPGARQYPTGLRETTPEERSSQQARTPHLAEVRPTRLGLDRLKQEVSAPKTALSKQVASAAARDLSALEKQVVEPGADLITATPTQRTFAASAAETPLPRSVDNSALPAFPEIRHQGGIGSCVGFAVGYYLYTHELGLLAGWNNKNTSNATKVSPKWAYNLADRGENDGTLIWTVHQVLQESGALMWADFPYNGDASNPINFREWPRTSALWKKALSFRSGGYAWVTVPGMGDPASFSQVKSVLLNGHVINFSTHIRGWQYDYIDNDPSTTADDAVAGQRIATWQDGWDGAHEMTVVGYNDDIWVDLNANGAVDAGEKGAFKVANSWGADWENAGFIWLAYDAMQQSSQVALGPTSPTRSALVEDMSVVVGARFNYQPNLVAEVTMSTANRGNLMMSLGMTEPDRTAVLNQWFPGAISNGGAYAFDGATTTTPVSASFAFDLTDLAASYGDLRYQMMAHNFGHFTSTVSGFAVVDRLRSNLRTASTEPVAVMGEGQEATQGVRYTFKDPSKVPQLTVSASSLPFGSLALGAKLDKGINLTNTGNTDLILTSLRFSSPLFLAPNSAYLRLAPGETQALSIQFAPASGQSETGTLNIRNTSSNQPSANVSLTGAGSSADDAAPLQVFITQQNAPNDNSLSLRAEVKNRTGLPVTLSNYRVVYYLNDPDQDPSGWVWDTAYSNVGAVTASAKKLWGTRTLGARKADTGLTFTFKPNTTVAAGASAIFQGTLHRSDYSWYPDETDDWSRYLRRDGMAEGTIVQQISNNAIVFGVGGDVQPGAYQFKLDPTTIRATDPVTSTFVVNDGSLGNECVYRFFSPAGALVESRWTYLNSLGQQTQTLDLSFLPVGKYTVILEIGGSPADIIEITRI